MIITLTGSTIQTIVEHSLGLYTDPNFAQCYWTNESVFNHQCILTPTDIVDLLSDFSGFEVDHIIPLNGRQVSGLHVPENLQVLTVRANRQKGAKFAE